MKYRPIIFSGPMVRAILEGRKTQTRRILPEKEADWSRTLSSLGSNVVSRPQNGMSNRYGYPGDRLWVRESFALIRGNEIYDALEGPEGYEYTYQYRAAAPTARWAGNWPNNFAGNSIPRSCKWKPSIHMPRAAARIILEITDVRIEHIQDISRAAAIAEGVMSSGLALNEWYDYERERYGLERAEASFMSLWQSIHGPESWELNPLVWVITFKRFEP